MKPRPEKGRLAPFVPLLVDTLKTDAWRATSHGARSLYIALKARHSSNFNNNGKIFLSQRLAVEELRSHHKQIGRWFRELQHYGFIVMTSPGCLGLEGSGKSPHWRLTELGHMGELPTRDYHRWNGSPFADQKIETRGGKAAQSVAEKRHTSVAEKQHSQEPDRGGKAAHKLEPSP